MSQWAKDDLILLARIDVIEGVVALYHKRVLNHMGIKKTHDRVRFRLCSGSHLLVVRFVAVGLESPKAWWQLLLRGALLALCPNPTAKRKSAYIP